MQHLNAIIWKKFIVQILICAPCNWICLKDVLTLKRDRESVFVHKHDPKKSQDLNRRSLDLILRSVRVN